MVFHERWSQKDLTFLRQEPLNATAKQVAVWISAVHSQLQQLKRETWWLIFYLFANGDVKKPTKLEALNKLVENFGTTLPSFAERTENYVDATKTTYKDYVQQITKNLLVDGVTYQVQSTRSQTDEGVIGWTDGPVFTNRLIDRILQRPGYAIGCDPSGTGPAVSDKIYGDWNCNANTIIPWIAYNRLNTNPSA